MKKALLLTLTAFLVGNANAADITGSAAGNFVNTGAGWTFSDTGTDVTGGSSFTNGVFTLSWEGDTSPGIEAFEVSIEGISLGILNSGTNADDRFTKSPPWDDDVEGQDVPGTGTVTLTDVELNAILADGEITVTFDDDLVGPGDWIDWWNQMDWELSYDEAAQQATQSVPQAVPTMSIWGIGILSGMIGLVGMYHRRRK